MVENFCRTKIGVVNLAKISKKMSYFGLAKKFFLFR